MWIGHRKEIRKLSNLFTKAFETLYSGQFTLSTQLLKPNYIVLCPVSNLILTVLQAIRTVDTTSEWLIVMACGNDMEGNKPTLIILKLSSFLSSLLLVDDECGYFQIRSHWDHTTLETVIKVSKILVILA